jgi:chromosome partitioning protein
MTKVISTINLKGGVGKTSTTVALAEFLAVNHNKKVLLIDLDPQTNATVALIGEDRWLEKNEKKETLFQLFKDKLDKTKYFKIENAIERKVSNIGGGIKNLDLLPSSLGLIDIQDSLALISAGRFHVSSPVTILNEEISQTINEYDVVLIDCPPNLGIITLNGILISDYYLIPCIPDIMSTYGIPQILNRIKSFNEETKKEVLPLGIIVSMYRAQSRLHDTTIKQLKQKENSGEYPKIFQTMIPLSVRTAEAADFSGYANTIKQKYGYGNSFDIYESLTRELLIYL